MKITEYRIIESSGPGSILTYYTEPYGHIWNQDQAESYMEYLRTLKPDNHFRLESRTVETTIWEKVK